MLLNNKNSNEVSMTSNGGAKNERLFNLDLEDLIDDDYEQIVLSPELLNAFVTCSKNKKNYNKDTIETIFKHVIFLYNDTMQMTDKYRKINIFKENI